MEIPKNPKQNELAKFNLKADVVKQDDVLKNDIVKVHDFFGKSKLINKMSDIFPKSEVSDNVDENS